MAVTINCHDPMETLRNSILSAFLIENFLKKELLELNVVSNQQMWLPPVSSGTLQDVINRREGCVTSGSLIHRVTRVDRM